MSSQNHVTVADLPAIKKLYKQAVIDKKESFMYNGNELLTAYAKYLIEYLETLKPKK